MKVVFGGDDPLDVRWYDATNTLNKINVSAVDSLPNAVQSLKAAGVPVVGGSGAGAGGAALGGLFRRRD